MSNQLTHHQVNHPNRQFPVVVICEDMSDPRNVGMAFRVCEAMGVKKLYLTGNTPTPPHKKISRTARSTDQHIAFEYCENILDLLTQLNQDQFWLCGLEITDKSQLIHQCNFNKHLPIAIIVGAEQQGISSETLKQLDHTVHINMYGKNSSMNVITALSISLYEITRQLST